jgi:transcriptional regulator with XRE-family HTH domain
MLQRFRASAGLSQEELAERAGLSRRGVSDLERGVRRTPYPATVRRLAEALDLAKGDRAALIAAARMHINRASNLDLSDHAPAQPDQPPKGTARRPHNLPVAITSFVGRGSELSHLEELLSTARLVTLVGVGGAGKTRLAFEVAARVLEGFAHGVWLVELAEVSDPVLVPQQVRSTPPGPNRIV